MDSLTHIALGACIGEAFFERKFGKKAMFWGALAQSIPDIDFVSGAWLGTAENLLSHRGFTHSILFAVLVIPLFALAVDKLHRPEAFTYRKLLLFFSIEVFLHLLLDGFNNYGVGWLEPFNHTRFSFNTIYVADPFLSLWPGIALVVLIFLNRYNKQRSFWWKFGLYIPAVYMLYCTYNKFKIDNDVKKVFTAQQIPHQYYFTTPAPLQNFLWYVVAGNDSGFYTGYRSVFDNSDKMQLEYFPRNEWLLKNITDTVELKLLKQFAGKLYTVEKVHDTLLFNDLRFGQEVGWQKSRGQFAFHYFLQPPADNRMVVQRGRFAGWSWNSFKIMLRKIKVE
ncbi:MAG: metal-dependent hydrolase [Bacteroidota bacterium]